MAEPNGAVASGPALSEVRNNFSSVSVVIPTFNRAQVVTEAVESALAQTFAPTEVIVVDDGSRDRTRQRLAHYLDRIKYIYQKNQGVSAARNAGIRAARGEWIAFLDSDDVWHPRKLEFQLAYLAEHSETALLGARAAGGGTRKWPVMPDAAAIRADTLALSHIVLRSPFPTSTVIARKRCLDAVGYFDTTLRNAEDRELYIRVGSRFAVVKLDATLAAWGGKGGEHLSMGSAAAEESTRKMIRGVFKRLEPLHGRYSLKCQALSHSAFEASYMYLALGQPLRALHRILRSFILWPLPYTGGETKSSQRVKRFAQILASLCCIG